MILNNEQNDRFFDTMDSLLYYVNERFRVVEGFTLDFANALDDVKGSLVAHTLWDNVEIIDDFVRDNPHRLPQRHLQTALNWKNALPGFYTLVRYQSGRAVLMNEAGVFSVCGVTYELEGEIGPAPAYVELVLLPFDDLIVYDGFLQAYDVDGTPAEMQRIQDEFENRCAHDGIALTAGDFMLRAEKHLAAERDKELEALLSGTLQDAVSGNDALQPGFHRGALAGLSPLERETAVAEWMSERQADKTLLTSNAFDERVRKREPATSLRDCLMLLTKSELEYVADALGMGGLMRLRKSEMVDEIAIELPSAVDLLRLTLLYANDGSYEMARTLARGGRVAFGPDEFFSHFAEWPLEPYVFTFRGANGYESLIPSELRRTFDAADIESIDSLRRQYKQAASCIEACVMTCGVASVDDVYDQYRALVADALAREDFLQLARQVESFDGAAFGLWSYPPSEYFVHYTLMPDFVAREYGRHQNASWTGLLRNVETGDISFEALNRAIGQARDDLAFELERLDQYKRELVASQANLPMRPLSRTLLENDVLGELLDNPNVMRLRAFIDAHVPDGEDDYTFADRVVEAVVLSSVESGNLQEVFSYLMELGLDHCSTDEGRIVTLATNVFNAMPSWENNGWSPQELYEQLTGRKVFYNDDGSVMRVGADEPCPCGSGRKYRECCGK